MKMKFNEKSKNPLDSVKIGQQLSTISTISLIVLMIFYLLTTTIGSMKLAEQTEIISEHPFEVVIAVSDAERYISEMSLRTERLQRHHDTEEIEYATIELAKLYDNINATIEKLEKLYLGDHEDIQELRDIIELLKTEQLKFLSYAENTNATGESIDLYNQENLSPVYGRALNQTNQIIYTAQEKKVGYGETAENLRKILLIGSAIIMSSMIGTLLLSHKVLRKQREELLNRIRLFDGLSQSIDDSFLICDEGTKNIRYYSLNMERLLGRTPDTGDVFEGLEPETVENYLQAIETDSVCPFEETVEYTKPDGGKLSMLIRIYKMTETRPPKFITVFSDRTDEIKHREALQDAMLSARQANKAKTVFLSRMSHEIRTPLNAIIGMTAIAEAHINDPVKVEDCLSKSVVSAKHLLMIINDVLDMSKIDSNKMVLQNEIFDIFELVNSFVSTIFSQAKAKQIEFSETMVGFGEHTDFFGDTLRLNQILLNIGSNAVKFTPPGGEIHLTVSRLASKSKADILRFSLSDTGIGMTKEAIERIFQPFEQADATIAGQYGGTGLGMAITGNLVSLMGGTIQIESEPGKGSTFIVDLPFQRGSGNIIEPDFANMGLSALIVDDELSVCEQTASLLEKIKISADWTLSGTMALKKLSERCRGGIPFDLCFIDWKMPDMDGVELTRRIRREIGIDVPIVLISAYDISVIEKEAREAGVNGFLPKPLYRSSVFSAVKEMLKKSETAFLIEEKNTKKPLEGKKILLAEDNEINQEVACVMLVDKGAQVSCANNGEEAVNMFLASENGEYDAILMDVQMPVLNGHQAAQKIRTSEHTDAMSIPIIAVTANAFSDDISAALAVGMNAHVSKPINIEQLCKTLTECIGNANMKIDGEGK